MPLVLLLLVLPVVLVVAVLGLAMWAVSDEPYEKVAPYRRPEAKTLLTTWDVHTIRRAVAAHEELRQGRQ